MKPPFDTTPIIIYPDGLAEEVLPFDEKYFSLEELQRIVGGYIELVRIVVCENDDETELEMYVNEEGKHIGLPINPMATLLYHTARITADTIRGTVLVTPPQFIARG